MSRTVSPSSNRPYGVARVVAVWNLARSSFYAARQRERDPREAQKRGPKVLSDAELMAEIRQLLDAPMFAGEGYRKIWARRRQQGVRTSRDRVLRLLRDQQWLSPARQPEPGAAHPHEGTILSEAPDQMWGTDATATVTDRDGTVTIFCRHRSLHGGMRGHPCGAQSHTFRGPGTHTPGRARTLWCFFRRQRRRLAVTSRPWQRLHERRFSEGDSVRRHRAIAGLRTTAGRKWLHRTLFPHPERAAPLGTPVSRSGGTP